MKKTILLCGLLIHTLVYSGETTISVRDLDSRVRLVGLLGIPLGEIVEIECKGIPEPIERKTKIPYWEFSVTVISVQGKPVTEAFDIPFVSFMTDGVKIPKPGVPKKIFGYETGGYSGSPKELFEYVPPIADAGFGFRTKFVALKESEKK